MVLKCCLLGHACFMTSCRLGNAYLHSALEAAEALKATAPSLGLMPNHSRGAGWSWRQCSCHRDPPVRLSSSSAEFRALVVLNHSCYVDLRFKVC